jgi:hypothetical protein
LLQENSFGTKKQVLELQLLILSTNILNRQQLLKHMITVHILCGICHFVRSGLVSVINLVKILKKEKDISDEYLNGAIQGT